MLTVRHKYLLMFILLLFSGNPLMSHVLGKYGPLTALLIVFILSFSRRMLNSSFNKRLIWIVAGLSVISFLQYLEFKFVAIEGITNLCAKIVLGGLIVNYLREEFVKIYFNVLSFLCVVSLVFFVVVSLLKIPVPYIQAGAQFHNFLLYNIPVESETIQNSGMFWEPGAFAGVITLGLLLNFNHLGLLLKQQRYKLLAVVIALLTTQSTTGYLVGFIIALFYLLINRNIFISIILVPVVLFIGFLIYNNTDFLKTKIEHQFEKSTYQSIGEFSNTRFGSLIFDWHYIKKHPIIGNGLHSSTRYMDHQYLFSGVEGDAIGSGNGFSHYLASMGILFVGGYFFFLWKSTNVFGNRYSFLFVLVVLLNLQGEQWFNFPLYLGLPFLVLSAERWNSSSNEKRMFHTNAITT